MQFIFLRPAWEPSHWPFCLQVQRVEQLCRLSPPGDMAGQGGGTWWRNVPYRPAVLISLLIKQRRSGSGVTQLLTQDGAHKERMPVFTCVRGDAQISTGHSCLSFHIENFILSLAAWGTARTGLMGPQIPQPHMFPRVCKPCVPRGSPGSRDWSSPTAPAQAITALPPLPSVPASLLNLSAL